MKLQRLIVTGPNGAGKSHLAMRLAAVRSDVPVVSFDAIKLNNNWKRRPQPEIDAELSQVVQNDAWILEGGPSLLPHAIKYADSVMWLTPSEWVRAWRLVIRPLRNIGQTRPELPNGNVDWPWEQFKFAMRSLRNRAKFQETISAQLAGADGLRVWRISNARDTASAIDEWRNAAGLDARLAAIASEAERRSQREAAPAIGWHRISIEDQNHASEPFIVGSGASTGVCSHARSQGCQPPWRRLICADLREEPR